jgi:putative RNA 2'-phosphotransferase
MNAQHLNQTSKLLSLVLRHDPAHVGLTLDPNGWVDVDVLLHQLAHHGHSLTREGLQIVVDTSDKKRFALSEDGRRIRANQGHTVQVDLGLTAQTPPDQLFHGTVERFLDSIGQQGLKPGQRHHVHLSPDRKTATAVGGRRGKPVILVVDAQRMHREGHVFYQSTNGVWLTDHVPAEFFQVE